MTNIYGFESTDDIQVEVQGLPVGTYKAMAIDEGDHSKDGVSTGIFIEWEVVEGENKGKKAKTWYNTKHSNKIAKDIALQDLKELARVTGKPIGEHMPIKGRVVTLVVDVQKNNPQYSGIKKYLPESYVAAPF